MVVQVVAGHCNFALCAKQDFVLWQEGDETAVRGSAVRCVPSAGRTLSLLVDCIVHVCFRVGCQCTMRSMAQRFRSSKGSARVRVAAETDLFDNAP